MHEPPLIKRYLYKLSSNCLHFLLNLIEHLIVPRLLGPISYGNFYFLNTLFFQIFNFFNGNLSNALYVKLSQRPDEKKLEYFYWKVLLGIFIFLSILIFILINGFNLAPILFPQQQLSFIWLAFGIGALTITYQSMVKIVDAHGLTIKGEIWQSFMKIGRIVGVVLLLKFQLSALGDFLSYQIVYLLLALLGLNTILRKFTRQKSQTPALKTQAPTHNYRKELWPYIYPLLTYSALVLAYIYADRWLLQAFYGSEEQGLYALAYNIASTSFLFCTAMSPLFTRELAKAYFQGNQKRILYFFNRLIPIFFTFSAYLSIFLAFNAQEITLLAGGTAFSTTAPILSIIALYPIHQTYGQLSGAFYYASGNTKRYRNIGICGILFGFVLSCLFVLPSHLGGLQLGAKGLALKMVLFQLFTTNTQLYFNSRSLKCSFIKILRFQFTIIALFTSHSLLTNSLLNNLQSPPLLTLLLKGLIYSFFVLLSLFAFPQLLGLSYQTIHTQIRSLSSHCLYWLKRKRSPSSPKSI